MAPCPFCKTALDDEAVVCRGCGARLGYTSAGGAVYGRGRTIAVGIILPAFFLIVPLYLLKVAFPPLQPQTFAVITLIWGTLLAIPILLSLNRLRRGPVWFR